VPPLAAYADEIGRALDRLPYRPRVVAEPGRVLVAEAGVLVTTVLGRARRRGRDWVHLDVGAFNGVMEALETGNRLAYPLSDSRRGIPTRCHVTRDQAWFRCAPDSRRDAATLTALLEAEDPSIKKNEAVRQHEEPIV
jgi:diaminopimelate decarboxylase